MSREFLSSPLLSHPTPMTLSDRILDILRRRHPLEQPMEHNTLQEAAICNGIAPNSIDFILAVQSLVDTGEVDVTWGHGGSGRMQAAYSATHKRKTDDTPKLEIPNAD